MTNFVIGISGLAMILVSCGFPARGGDIMTQRSVQKDPFGVTAGGEAVERYTLRNAGGMTVRLIACGAAVSELWAPDRRGEPADVVLGFDNLAQYEDAKQNPYFGGTVGRMAFRITQGRFTLDGKVYQLSLNIPPHHLHGGTRGLSRVVWKAEPLAGDNQPAVRFRCRSLDGDQGYPGNLDVSVTYTLTDRNELKIDYAATTDRPTPVNLTHHSYFNLAGAGSGSVLGHVLELRASRYTPLDEKLIPTGKIVPVAATPFDFTKPTPIGARVQKPSQVADGYDLSYVLDRCGTAALGCPGSGPVEGESSAGDQAQPGAAVLHAATLREPASGRVMEVFTTQPAVVLYTGNYLDGTVKGKRGAIYAKHAGVCLETAHLPDSVNQPAFPSVILQPGQTYRQTCVYRFSAR
jgi:aldose 1-epimerase